MKFKPWIDVPTGLAPVPRNLLPQLGEPPILRTTVVNPPRKNSIQDPMVARAWRWAGLIAAPALTYHGFKRTGSVGWAVAWSAFGAVLPFVAVPLAFAQGFGQEKRS